jgi:ABC-type transport system substrate-binding protein
MTTAERGGPVAAWQGRRIAGALFASLALIVNACGATTTPSQSPGASVGAPSEPSASAAAPSGSPAAAAPSGELIVALAHLGSQQFAPSQAYSENEYTTFILGEQLFTMNPETRQIEGLLAESAEISPDKLTWTIKLRPNIPFHGGWGTVTSEDVKYTWSQYIREDNDYSIKGPMQRMVDNDMANFEVVDELTFKLHMSEPFVYLPARLAEVAAGPWIRSAKYHAEDPNADNHPIGTGPFKFVSNQPQVEVVYEAVPDHWRNPPGVARLVLREIPDASARLLAVQSGEVDIASLAADLVNEARSDANLKITPIQGVANAYVVLGGMFNGTEKLDRDAPWIQADAPEKGLAIRQAMSLAIDRQTILDRVLFGEGQLTHAATWQDPANPEHVDPSWELPAYDPELAKQKLAEGGYPNGFDFQFPLYDQSGLATAAVGQVIADQWEAIGLRPERRNVEEDAYMGPKVDNRETAGLAYIFASGWYPEVAIRLNTLLPERTDAKYIVDYITDTERALNAEPDLAKRYQLAREMGTKMIEDIPALPLFTMNGPYVVGPDVVEWTPMPSWDQISRLFTAKLAS